jgi:hypothetical protein
MMLGAAQASQAAIVDWTLSNGTFDDGGTFSGTFTFDTAADTITTWDITTTTGVGSTTHYQPGSGFLYSNLASDGGSGPVFDSTFLFLGAEFSLTNLPLSGPGFVDHLTGSEVFSAFIFPVSSHTVTDGQAVGVLAGGVPEPATWAMMILGAGLAGASLRRSRRAAVAA